MNFIKKNSLFFSLCLLLIVTIFSFKLCSKAYFASGTYVKLETSWNRYTTEATAWATNISGTVRYTGCIIKKDTGAPYASNYGTVSSGVPVYVTGVLIPADQSAYAEAVIYRSTSSPSGSVESIRVGIPN